MKQVITLITILCSALPSLGQTLSLDSCRAMALRNNRQLAVGRVKKDIAENVRKAARTHYLPKVTAVAGYELMSKEVSLLNNGQKSALNHLGTNALSPLSDVLSNQLTNLVKNGVIDIETAQMIGEKFEQYGGEVANAGDKFGQSITDAFRTDTRQVFAGTVMLTQPIYMGGAITALNKMADIHEKFVGNSLEVLTDETLYNIDHVYWLVVSLRHKYELAKSFNKLVSKLNDDVEKMIKEGVATRADGLKVAVKVNESEIALTQAENGISLAKMLLCQECGIPVDSEITLEDENAETIAVEDYQSATDEKTAISNRAETRMLENAVEMTRQTTNLIRAAFLPQVALTGGYLISNPNLFNGFEKRFSGMWNVGLMVRMPVWNWFEGAYKVRAAKSATTIAEYELSEAKEKMELQIAQAKFKIKEANKRLAMATKNTKSAEENLRCADLGFKEGVMNSTEVIGAQTAWFQAQSQKIDAEIDLKMSQLNLQKAMGQLTF